MKSYSSVRLALMLLAVELAGCASLSNQWSFGSHLRPAPAPSYHARHQFPPTSVTEQHEEPAGTQHAGTATGKQTATPAAPAPAAPAAPAGMANVTLEDSDADQVQAKALLNNADTRLARIDPSKLTGENATAYSQASDLANAARKAMGQRDYLAASGLARKSALLTEPLMASRSSVPAR